MDLSNSKVAMGLFDPTDGPVESLPTDTDGLASLGLLATQHLRSVDPTTAYLRALAAAKAAGVVMHGLNCAGGEPLADGSFDTPSPTVTRGQMLPVGFLLSIIGPDTEGNLSLQAIFTTPGGTILPVAAPTASPMQTVDPRCADDLRAAFLSP